MGSCLFFNRVNPQPLFATIHLTLRDFAGLDQRFPEHCRDSVQNYIEKGHPVGGFLYAVFCNDLVDAFNHAHSVNSRRLHDYAEFLYNYAPQACYGSPEAYEAWIKSGGLIGQTTTA